MSKVVLVVVLGVILAGCWQAEQELPLEVSSCAASLYSPYKPRDFEQCVNVCIHCKKGVRVTCSTACRLKGAR